MTVAQQPKLTAEQLRQVNDLREAHGVDIEEITFLSTGDPWLNSKTRLRLARSSDLFASIESRFIDYFEEPSARPLKSVQVIYNTSVTKRDGQLFDLPGVATVGEKLWNGEEADPHELALSRSMANALDAAGWNPLGRPRTAAPPAVQSEEADANEEAAEAAQRVVDLRRIHAVARTVELIKGGDERLYRSFLVEFYRTTTSGAMDRTQRASLINKLLVDGPRYAREHGVKV